MKTVLPSNVDKQLKPMKPTLQRVTLLDLFNAFEDEYKKFKGNQPNENDTQKLGELEKLISEFMNFDKPIDYWEIRNLETLNNQLTELLCGLWDKVECMQKELNALVGSDYKGGSYFSMLDAYLGLFVMLCNSTTPKMDNMSFSSLVANFVGQISSSSNKENITVEELAVFMFMCVDNIIGIYDPFSRKALAYAGMLFLCGREGKHRDFTYYNFSTGIEHVFPVNYAPRDQLRTIKAICDFMVAKVRKKDPGLMKFLVSYAAAIVTNWYAMRSVTNTTALQKNTRFIYVRREGENYQVLNYINKSAWLPVAINVDTKSEKSKEQTNGSELPPGSINKLIEIGHYPLDKPLEFFIDTLAKIAKIIDTTKEVTNDAFSVSMHNLTGILSVNESEKMPQQEEKFDRLSNALDAVVKFASIYNDLNISYEELFYLLNIECKSKGFVASLRKNIDILVELTKLSQQEILDFLLDPPTLETLEEAKKKNSDGMQISISMTLEKSNIVQCLDEAQKEEKITIDVKKFLCDLITNDCLYMSVYRLKGSLTGRYGKFLPEKTIFKMILKYYEHLTLKQSSNAVDTYYTSFITTVGALYKFIDTNKIASPKRINELFLKATEADFGGKFNAVINGLDKEVSVETWMKIFDAIGAKFDDWEGKAKLLSGTIKLWCKILRVKSNGWDEEFISFCKMQFSNSKMGLEDLVNAINVKLAEIAKLEKCTFTSKSIIALLSLQPPEKTKFSDWVKIIYAASGGNFGSWDGKIDALEKIIKLWRDDLKMSGDWVEQLSSLFTSQCTTFPKEKMAQIILVTEKRLLFAKEKLSGLDLQPETVLMLCKMDDTHFGELSNSPPTTPRQSPKLSPRQSPKQSFIVQTERLPIVDILQKLKPTISYAESNNNNNNSTKEKIDVVKMVFKKINDGTKVTDIADIADKLGFLIALAEKIPSIKQDEYSSEAMITILGLGKSEFGHLDDNLGLMAGLLAGEESKVLEKKIEKKAKKIKSKEPQIEEIKDPTFKLDAKIVSRLIVNNGLLKYVCQELNKLGFNVTAQKERLNKFLVGYNAYQNIKNEKDAFALVDEIFAPKKAPEALTKSEKKLEEKLPKTSQENQSKSTSTTASSKFPNGYEDTWNQVPTEEVVPGSKKDSVEKYVESKKTSQITPQTQQLIPQISQLLIRVREEVDCYFNAVGSISKSYDLKSDESISKNIAFICYEVDFINKMYSRFEGGDINQLESFINWLCNQNSCLQNIRGWINDNGTENAYIPLYLMQPIGFQYSLNSCMLLRLPEKIPYPPKLIIPGLQKSNMLTFGGNPPQLDENTSSVVIKCDEKAPDRGKTDEHKHKHKH